MLAERIRCLTHPGLHASIVHVTPELDVRKFGLPSGSDDTVICPGFGGVEGLESLGVVGVVG
jgi:hypothetical protein